MRLSTVLLFCIWIASLCGTLNGAYKRYGFHRGKATGSAVLLLALSAFEIPLGDYVTLNPASALLVLLAVWLLYGTGEWGIPVLLALLSAILGWILYSALPGFQETGILVALPGCMCAFFLKTPRKALACALLTPLFFGMIALIEDWYLFDMLQIPLGNGVQLDAQIFGALASGAFQWAQAICRQSAFRKRKVA